MTALYNEIDPYAAQWLRNLVAAGHIAPGVVDERSIRDLRAVDVAGYTQCHFFAGIGVWSLALRMAGWPDDEPVWTGSCPCQPFSVAGRGAGFSDDRHLWPAFFDLIRECRPDTIFGEQVAGPDGLHWFDLVSGDLEGAGYAAGASNLSAAGFGAPHIRQRLYWVADAESARRRRWRPGEQSQHAPFESEGFGEAGRLAHPQRPRFQTRSAPDLCGEGRREEGREPEQPGFVNGHWADADWVFCRDESWRPVEYGSFPLAHGPANRVGRLRATGNAVIPQVAAGFIAAYIDTLTKKELT